MTTLIIICNRCGSHRVTASLHAWHCVSCQARGDGTDALAYPKHLITEDNRHARRQRLHDATALRRITA